LIRRQPRREILRVLEDAPAYGEMLRQYPGAASMLDA
jgi:hypothetical protein